MTGGRSIDSRNTRARIDRAAHLRSELIVERDADGDVVRVVTNAPLTNSSAVRRLDEHRVGADLDPIAPPSLARSGRARGLPALVLVRDELAAPHAQDIHRAAYPQLAILELEPLDGVALILRDLDVQAPACVHGRVCGPKSFNFLKVEETFAIRERVERGYADQGVVHGASSELPLSTNSGRLSPVRSEPMLPSD